MNDSFYGLEETRLDYKMGRIHTPTVPSLSAVTQHFENQYLMVFVVNATILFPLSPVTIFSHIANIHSVSWRILNSIWE